ncbi:DUF839 domain-containing protein [Vibrio lentus]|nr:DUF839 domain-containing protein [Vibrio lentus]
MRWDEGESATDFTWDIFGNSRFTCQRRCRHQPFLLDMNGLTVDGLAFDARGILWIQTDNGADE